MADGGNQREPIPPLVQVESRRGHTLYPRSELRGNVGGRDESFITRLVGDDWRGGEDILIAPLASIVDTFYRCLQRRNLPPCTPGFNGTAAAQLPSDAIS